MKKLFLTSVIVLGAAVCALAQEGKSYPATLELNRSNSLWFNSSNAAGMSVNPLDDFSLLTFGYDIYNGDFRLQQDGNKNILGIAAEGAASLGKGKMWGSFNYSNISQKDTRYNTMTLNLEDDMPYIVADHNLSPWKSQRYDLALKAASPLCWDMVSFGVAADYFSQSGAKQVDPRCSDYEYGVSVDPSVVFNFGKHNAGLALSYHNGNVRESPINSNSQQDQEAYILRGLGNYTDAVVGSLSGINSFYINRNRYGASLQYGFDAESFKLLAEGYASLQMLDVFQTPTKPQNMGTTVQHIGGGKLQASYDGSKFINTLTFEGSYRHTSGIEYIQELNKTYEVQKWETIAKYVRSTYELTRLALNYDFFVKNEYGYSWNAGFKGNYDKKNDKYILPESTLGYTNLYMELFVKKNFMAGSTSLLASLSAGHNFNLSGEYNYNGADADSWVVKDFYEKDFAVLSSGYNRIAASLNVSFPIGKKSSVCFLKGDCRWLKACGDTMSDLIYTNDKDGNFTGWNYKTDLEKGLDGRLYTSFTVGFTF